MRTNRYLWKFCIKKQGHLRPIVPKLFENKRVIEERKKNKKLKKTKEKEDNLSFSLPSIQVKFLKHTYKHSYINIIL